MTTKVSQYMGGLGIDTRDVLGADANGTVTVGDGFSTGNLFVGGETELGNFTANGAAIFGSIEGTNIRNRFVYSAYNNQMYQQIGDGTAGSGGTFNYGRYLESQPEHIAMSINTITLSSSFTGNVDIGTNATNTLVVTGNADISDNLFVAKTVAISGNTNPAATDSLVVAGNVRLTAGSIIFADGSTQSSGSGAADFPTGDYGLLDSANAATDAFGQTTAGLTTFDMLTAPVGSLDTEDLGALS
jgi:hypothetical protein